MQFIKKYGLWCVAAFFLFLAVRSVWHFYEGWHNGRNPLEDGLEQVSSIPMPFSSKSLMRDDSKNDTTSQSASSNTQPISVQQRVQTNRADDNGEAKPLIQALEKESEEISLQYGSKSVASITPVAHTVFLTVPALYARSVDEPPIPEANSADEDDATTRLRRVGVISRPAPTQWTAWVYTPTGYRIDRVAYPPDTENLFTEVLYEDGGRHVFFGNGSSSAPLKKKSAARRFCNVGGYPVTITIFFSQQK